MEGRTIQGSSGYRYRTPPVAGPVESPHVRRGPGSTIYDDHYTAGVEYRGSPKERVGNIRRKILDGAEAIATTNTGPVTRSDRKY